MAVTGSPHPLLYPTDGRDVNEVRTLEAEAEARTLEAKAEAKKIWPSKFNKF